MILFLIFVGSYLLGSIPFGVFVAKSKGIDITKIGSGNIGATNVHRVLGWKAGIPVMILDIAKGLVPPLVVRALAIAQGPLTVVDVAFLAGIVAVLGHCFSIFLGFKGGKGIATILGAAIGATPIIAAIGAGIFAVLYATTRYVSVASIVAVIAATAAALFLRYDALIVSAYVAIAFFIIYKHRANIRRLLRGEEPRTSFKGGEKRGEA